MRVLVASTAGSGHFGPLVPVAHACREAGHEVAVAAPESFAAEVADAGLEHRPFADVPPDALGAVMGRLPGMSMEEANRTVVAEVFGRLDAQAALAGATATVEEWRPDLVLREPVEFGSLAAALCAGVPHAVVAVGVAALMEQVGAMVAPSLAELDTLAGLPLGSCSAAARTAPTLSSVPTVLDDVRPSDAEHAGPVHRYRAPAASGDGGLPEAWGDPDQPLVYVSFGSVAAALPPFAGIYPAVLEALAEEPVRVLLTTGRGVAVDTLTVPPNTRVEQWWPQADVLPYAAAVVGHGGFGTTMAALAAGVPQVVLPLFAMDQFVNADHVAAVGAGLTVAGGPAAAGELPAALALVLHDGDYRAAARTVADQMAQLPPVADVVPVLEQVAS
ncbi:MAG TPA: glycosyltransferase [Nocardioides sp.]|uniref:glycosyltransferase n=1 Tax=Nocardioides sp. TaxID=35761 RepID=UPI002BCEDF98|nr:glycosyltransferase [Nocardioides sp.]HTW18021.1 glycosyltransferase [Nocardioides sp.]